MRIDRVLAPNPGPYTGPGTNTYVVGDDDEVVVIDPGPIETSHADQIVATIAQRQVTAVVVTHTHIDHAPLANPLARRLGSPALGYRPGPHFDPDAVLKDGDTVETAGLRLEVVYTPGHADDHLCFRAGDTVFTGDHILGGTSVMVDDVTSYMRSLDRVAKLEPARLFPGHGHRIDRPAEVISWYIAHRRERESQILDAIRAGAGTVGEVVERVYQDVDSDLYPLAARSVAAHLRKLHQEARVRFGGGSAWSDQVEAM